MDDQNKNLEFRERLLNFSVEILKFLSALPYKKEYDVIRYQLSKSATSIGANYEESQNASYKEFIHRVKIALREAGETHYWLKIVDSLNIANQNKIEQLLNESKQISLIFGAIASKAESKIREREKYEL